MMTPEERRLLGKVAAHESWARTDDRTARTSPARAAMWQKFMDEAGGDEERARHLWKAHFARLALKSAVSRRLAKEARDAAAAADRELAEADRELAELAEDSPANER